MDKFRAMRTFVKVAQTSSFIKAANLLNMSVGVASRHVALLEDELGVRLLNRTTRKVSLTEAGALFTESCQRVLDELDEALSISTSTTRPATGRLRVSAPTVFAISRLAPLLTLYRTSYPDVTIDLMLVDRPVDLVEEQLDVCIVPAHHVKSLNVVSRPLTISEFHICATPSHLSDHGAPLHPSDLADHAFLAYRSDHREEVMVFKDAADVAVEVLPKSAVTSNNFGLLRESALADLGIAMLPAYIVQHDIAEGRLVQVLNEFQLPVSEHRIVYSTRRHLSAKTRGFIDLALELFQAESNHPSAASPPCLRVPLNCGACSSINHIAPFSRLES
ncbi:LysR family transcriptional regulator [Burkholderia cenocepacia]|uniref:LysR family transcriptional regulator n=1 Tax=Burkholderia cenocepacia TaxID=95486 RepID=UPI0009826466|nr:LysR family transcriptional regulator [Burkholderia cenocepacia]ONY00632.1 LysR family transcriptional regulator [Burkholderia cenocepacia]